MFHRLVLGAALLSVTGVSFFVHGKPQKVLAFVGEEVILPCRSNVSVIDDFPTVEWSKKGLKPNVIFLYRDGCETYEMKNPAFEDRTSLVTKELKNGHVSLRLSNVQLADAGKYQCMKIWKKDPRVITTVELVVAAVSEPKLSVVSADSGGVILQCEVSCWQLEPQINLLDDRGNDMPAQHPKREQDAARGCFSVTQRVFLQRPTSSVTCRVHQPEFNQTRDTTILIPADCMRSDLVTIGLSVGMAASLLVASGLAALMWKRSGKSAERGQSMHRLESADSTMSDASENQLLLKPTHSEKLRTEVAVLKAKIQAKEKTISQLLNNMKDQQHCVVCHHCDHNPKPAASTSRSPPTPGSLPQRQNSSPGPNRPFQRSHCNYSSPALTSLSHSVASSISSSTTEKKLGRIGRSRSVSYDESKQNDQVLQRRHSSALLLTLSNNCYSPLAKVSEE